MIAHCSEAVPPLYSPQDDSQDGLQGAFQVVPYLHSASLLFLKLLRASPGSCLADVSAFQELVALNQALCYSQGPHLVVHSLVYLAPLFLFTILKGIPLLILYPTDKCIYILLKALNTNTQQIHISIITNIHIYIKVAWYFTSKGACSTTISSYIYTSKGLAFIPKKPILSYNN